MRIGLIGGESSHADALVRWLAAHPDTGARVVRGTPADLVGRVDGAVVLGRDAGRHRADAEPLLCAGLPVFVDKPFAVTVTDAEAMLEAAHAGGGRVTSFSALRLHPEVAALRDAVGGSGRVRSVVVSGPTDPGSPHGGRVFYAPHSIELALALAPGPVHDVGVRRDEDAVVLRWRTSCAIEVRLRGPEAPFRAEIATGGGTRRSELTLGAGYFDPVAGAIVGFLAGGPAPVGEREVCDVVALLEAVGAAETGPGR